MRDKSKFLLIVILAILLVIYSLNNNNSKIKLVSTTDDHQIRRVNAAMVTNLQTLVEVPLLKGNEFAEESTRFIGPTERLGQRPNQKTKPVIYSNGRYV